MAYFGIYFNRCKNVVNYKNLYTSDVLLSKSP